MDKLHVSATSVAMNYLPEYLAVELGYFKDVDLEVTSEAPADWTDVLKHVDSGRAQIVLGGIWVPSIYRKRVKDYFAFAKVTSRFPACFWPGNRAGWKISNGRTWKTRPCSSPAAAAPAAACTCRIAPRRAGRTSQRST